MLRALIKSTWGDSAVESSVKRGLSISFTTVAGRHPNGRFAELLSTSRRALGEIGDANLLGFMVSPIVSLYLLRKDASS